MRKINYIFWLKSLSKSTKFLLSAVIMSLTSFVFLVVAAPPSSYYSPGETLEPNCAPGDTNCSVLSPAISGVNSDITSLTGLTTALSVIQGGTGLNSITSGKLLYATTTNVMAELTLDTTLGISDSTLSVQDNSITGAKISLGSDAQGDIMFYNGTDWARLGAGTDGQYLKTTGAGSDPEWSNLSIDLATTTTVYVDSINGTATGRGTINDPLDTIYNATQWIESSTGGNDVAHDNFWVIQLAPGTYYGTGFDSDTIVLDDGVSLKGSGNTNTNVKDKVHLHRFSGIRNLKIDVDNQGTEGLIRCHEGDYIIEQVLLSGNDWSGASVGIWSQGGEGRISDVLLEMTNHDTNEVIGISHTGSGEIKVQNVTVAFFPGDASTPTRAIESTNASGDVRVRGVYHDSQSSFADTFYENGGVITLDKLGTGKLEVDDVFKVIPKSTATCDTSNEGGIYYDSDDDHFYGCNGTSWVQLDN